MNQKLTYKNLIFIAYGGIFGCILCTVAGVNIWIALVAGGVSGAGGISLSIMFKSLFLGHKF
jgi:hypothetical protein